PAPAGGADPVSVAPGQHAGRQPLGPVPLHLRLRRPGGLALAGLLRDLARDRRVAAAGGEINPKSEARNPKQYQNPNLKSPKRHAPQVSVIRISGLEFVSDFGLRISDLRARREAWPTWSRSARARAACRSWTCSPATRASGALHSSSRTFTNRT